MTLISADGASVADNDFLTIRPISGTDIIVRNIYHEKATEIYKSDGINNVIFDNHDKEGHWSSHFFHVTYGDFLKIKNVSGSSAKISYDAVIVKEAV